MSLYRQMWLTVFACMALAFAVSLGASLFGAHALIERQLSAKDADAASALALSMSQLPKDRVTLELQAAGLFEQGQYEAVRVRAMDGTTLVDFQAPARMADGLLARALPIAARPGLAEISDGPLRFGTVELASLRDEAQAQLDAIVMRLMTVFAVAALVAGMLATLVLRRLHAPLREVVRQAEAVRERRFVEAPEPRVPELAGVVRAMNEMVRRLRAMFDEEAARLRELQHTANHDALTGIANRAYFMQSLHARLGAGEQAAGGVLLLARLRELAEVNRRLGRGECDRLLERIGGVFAAQAEAGPKRVAGRLNGADFALLLPADPDAQECAQSLLRALSGCGDATLRFAVGVAAFEAGDTAAHVLARADSALGSAEQKEQSTVELASAGPNAIVRAAEDWRARLEDVLEMRRLRVAAYPVRRLGGTLLHRECFLRIDPEGDDAWLPAGQCMPHVIRHGLSARFDLAVARQVLDAIRASGEARALNLCTESLRIPGFRAALADLLARDAQACSMLWVELPEDALHEREALSELAAVLRRCGVRFGLEHFGHELGRIRQMRELGLDYAKVDAAFLHDIATSEHNRRFLSGMCGMLKGMDCLVIAEGVQDASDLDLLARLGFDAVGGPAVNDH